MKCCMYNGTKHVICSLKLRIDQSSLYKNASVERYSSETKWMPCERYVVGWCIHTVFNCAANLVTDPVFCFQRVKSALKFIWIFAVIIESDYGEYLGLFGLEMKSF